MSALHALKGRWAALAPREQRGVALAAAALLLTLVWLLAVAPALRTLREAPAKGAQLRAQLEQMQALAAQAQQLQALPVLSRLEAQNSLQSAATALGKAATLQVVGDRATLTLKQVSPAALAPWLARQAGSGINPSDIHVQRDSSGAEPSWSGSLVFQLPSAATP